MGGDSGREREELTKLRVAKAGGGAGRLQLCARLLLRVWEILIPDAEPLRQRGPSRLTEISPCNRRLGDRIF